MNSAATPEQSRRIRRNAIVLGLVAAGFFVAFIAAGILRGQGL